MTIPISNMRPSFSNSSITYTGIGMDINASSYEANSKIINLKTNGNNKFSVDMSGELETVSIKASSINVSNAIINNKTIDDIAKSRAVAMTIVFG